MGVDGQAPRVGLVLGAGGTLGAAWHSGALAALTTATGWDPGSAARIVGTSAGSVIGSLLACGIPPWYLAAHARGERFPGLLDAHGKPAGEADRTDAYKLASGRHGIPALGPGSWKLAARSLRAPRRLAPAAVVAAWAPRGVVSTGPIKRVIAAACEGEWAPHDGLRVVACDYATGRRVAFGAPDAPEVSLPDAVAASCAIPAFFTPVAAAGRRWVDGGIRSPSNADLLAGEGLDLVVVLSPMSSRAPTPGRGAGARMSGRMRRDTGARLGVEARRLRAEGTEVVILQPGAEDLEVLGHNAMNATRRAPVAASAERTVGALLRDDAVATVLAQLPRADGALTVRPDGPPESWPRFGELAAARAA